MAMEGWVNRSHQRAFPSLHNLFGAVGMWDSIWYRQIALQGYDPALFHANTPAFSPLWPGCLWLLRQVTWWIDLNYSGALLSTLLFAVGLCMLYRLTDDLLGRAIARRAVLYLAISPLAFVFSMVYAESLFLVLAVGSFLLIERRHALLVVRARRARRAGPAGRHHARARPRLAHLARRPRHRRLAARPCGCGPCCCSSRPSSPGPATCGGASATCTRRRAPRSAAGAAARPFPPSLLIQTFIDEVWHRHMLRYAVHLSFAALWLGLLVTLFRQRRQIPLEYAIFASGVVLLPFFAGTVLSAGRLGMMGFPLFWSLAILGRREGVDTAVKILFPPMMAALMFVAFAYQTFTP